MLLWINDETLVSCGKNHVSFWTLESEIDKDEELAWRLVKKSGVFGEYEAPKALLSMCLTADGFVLSGDSSGNLLLWSVESRSIRSVMRNVHEGGVFSIVPHAEGGGILTGGGKDGCVKWWARSDKGMYELLGSALVGGGAGAGAGLSSCGIRHIACNPHAPNLIAVRVPALLVLSDVAQRPDHGPWPGIVE